MALDLINPSKTTSTTFGTNHLTQLPTWHICHNILELGITRLHDELDGLIRLSIPSVIVAIVSHGHGFQTV